jgi:type II secretory ATPase GspE/PulE/Tfp pilus assembly ATPase PilB-like protein
MRQNDERLDAFLGHALDQGASSIHIDMTAKKATCRIDGAIYDYNACPAEALPVVVHELQSRGQIDIEEHRLHQLGSFSFAHGDDGLYQVDVSVSPGVFGEHITLRFWPVGERRELALDELGMDDVQLANWRDALHKREGMVIVSGSVFDGKNTTMYSSLLELQRTGRGGEIATIELHPRRRLPGIHQTKVDDDIGLNEASYLRHFQYSDFDVVYVRELRDFETLQLCFDAVLTRGTFLLSTVHTNSAAAVFHRLMGIGAEPWLVANGVSLVQGQRRIRRLCDACKEPVTVEPDAFLASGLSEEGVAAISHLRAGSFYRPVGCTECFQTGFRKTVLVCESMPVTEELRKLILKGASSRELENLAIAQGMKTQNAHALEHLQQGMISVEDYFLHFSPV